MSYKYVRGEQMFKLIDETKRKQEEEYQKNKAKGIDTPSPTGFTINSLAENLPHRALHSRIISPYYPLDYRDNGFPRRW